MLHPMLLERRFGEVGVGEVCRASIALVYLYPTNIIFSSIEKVNGKYDFVFIDVNKDGYIGCLKAILRRDLLAPNGLIIADNVRRAPS